MTELTPGLKGGKKQHFNRVNADLICDFHDVMGWEKTKEVFELKDNTLVDILKRQDIRPAVRKIDQIKIRQTNIESKVLDAIGNAGKHRSNHERKAELRLGAIEVIEKVVIPLLREAEEVGITEIEESQTDFRIKTPNVYVMSRNRSKRYMVRPY